MSSSPSPTIILISGAWHTDFHIQPCVPAFQKLGYHIIPCCLPSAGISKPPTVFDDDVAKIENAIENATNSGANVCVIAHSAAGNATIIATSHFLQNNQHNPVLQSRLKRLCCLATYTDTLRAGKEASWFGIDEATGYFTAARTATVFYNDMSEEASKPYVDALVLQTPVVPPNDLPSTFRESKTMKRSYIVCLQDEALSVAVQRLEAEEGAMEVLELDTGHCPFVSQPDVFAKFVDDVLQQDLN